MTAEVRAVEPLIEPPDVTMVVPGSKSMTNRALLLAALADGESRLSGALLAEDTEAMMACVGGLGAEVDVDRASGVIGLRGVGSRVAAGPLSFDANQSGTTGRFISAAVLAGRGRYEIDGHEQLRGRPMGPLVRAMISLGARVDSVDDGMPLVIDVGHGLAGGSVALDTAATSQFASALLMVGPLLPPGLEITLEGRRVSQPYLEMTVAMMRRFGARVDIDGATYRVEPTGYVSCFFAIEPDASAASYFFGAAAMTGGRVSIAGFSEPVLQGDLGFVDLLARMGATVEREGDTVTVQGGSLHGIDVDMRDRSDTMPTLAVVAAGASGPTRITGIGFVRQKESNRIKVVVEELTRLGIEAREEDDGLVIHPGPYQRATVATHDDHRIAMGFALLGLREPGIDIADPGCVAKTFPGYFDCLDRLRSGRPQEAR